MGRLPSRLVVPVVMLLFSTGYCIGASATYTYKGNPFTAVEPPYATSNFISGSITLNSPLAANLSVQTISPDSVLTYSFSDGINTWDPTNSAIRTGELGFSTDSNGVITSWGIGLAGNAGSVSNGYLFTVSLPADGDVVDEVVLGSTTVAEYGYNQSVPGAWSTSINCSLLRVAPANLTFGQGGGSGTASFNSGSCNWSIIGNPSWIVLPVSSGTSSTFSFTIQPNPGATRQATLSINGGALSIAITQTGLVCTYTITDAAAGFGVSRSFPSSGGSGGINVAAPAGCSWTATPSQSFITISGSASGSGNGSVRYSVAPNASSNPQAGAIMIAGLAYVINEQAAGAQAPSCSASSAASLIRPEGYSERVADVVVVCNGQAPPGGLTGDIQVSFHSGVTTNIGVTNLLLSAGQTDALLLEDEPTAANLALGLNAFRGVLSSANGTAVILFPEVQLASVSGGSFSHTWRITNARVNAEVLGQGSTVQAAVSIAATAPFTVSGQPTVATVSQASTFSVPASSAGSGQTIQPVSFTEGFATAFEPRLAANQDPSQTGAVYNSESGYVNTAKLGTQTGFATNGTRLIAAISNVPAGVSVYAPVAPASGTNAGLVSASATGAGGSPVAGTTQFNGASYQQIILIAGAGTATWEVTSGNPNTIETQTFNLVLVNPGAVSLAGITYAGALAPVSSGPAPQLPSTNLPVPRFASSAVVVSPPGTVSLTIAPQQVTAQGALKTSLRSEAAPSNSAVGGTVTWTQLQANTGSVSGSTAPNVVVGGTLPPTWVITNCTPVDSGGVCPILDSNNLSNAYTATYPSLSPGQTGTIVLTAQSGSQTSGAVEYTSTIDSDLSNSDPTAGSFTTNFPVAQIGLNVTLTHAANFSQGQAGAQYSVVVANGGSIPTSLLVTVTETLPPSLTLVSMAGVGWTCTLSTSSCTRSDALAANSPFPSITVTVNVASSAPGSVTNQVTAATGVLQATGSDVTNINPVVGGPPAAFFNGQASLGSNVYYLAFPNGNLFGYYSLQFFPIVYHYDLGFEAFVDGGNGGAYLYDFTSSHWFFTSPTLFPYLYDFTLNSWLYYFPATNSPGHYTTSPRTFSDLTTGKIIMM